MKMFYKQKLHCNFKCNYQIDDIFFTGIPEEDLLTELNSLLPGCVQVLATKKVTAGFNSKTACDSRSYVSII